MKTNAKDKLATKEHSAVSRNRIQTCPQTTQNNAEMEKEFICVYLRVLRAKVFSFAANLIILSILFILSNRLQAQIPPAWIAHYNNGITTGTNQAVKMALDSAGNIYVTGFSQNANTNLGYVTIKYAPNGTQLWASRYDSTNYPSAAPTNLVVDASNNVIVTGNAVTVKYDPNGNQLWTAPYSGAALAADSNTYVYVTGFGTSFNTVKLSPTGSFVWETTYVDVGPTIGQAILVDSNSNIYVTGYDNWYYYEYVGYVQLLTIKYDTNGSQIWMATVDNGGDGFYPGDVNVRGVATDGIGDLYIEANLDIEGYLMFKYANNGNLIWTAYDPSSSASDVADGMALDSSNDVLLTGSFLKITINGYKYYYSTFKLNSAGSFVWTNDYPQPPVGSSVANAIAVDFANSVYVTGSSSGTSASNDIVTIKYGSNGNQSWVQRYFGPGNGNAAGNAIAVDNAGNVYVTGYDTTSAGGTEIVTIKYAPVAIQRLGNGDILLQAQGSPSENFDVQASPNMQTWQDLGTSAADTNGLFQYTDTTAPTTPARFFDLIPQ